MTEYMKTYKALSQPPKWALKQIQAGRLKGKTDINPQWRYQAMTEQFGPCGIGWKYEVKRLWNEDGPEGQVFAFAEVNLYIRDTSGPNNTIMGWSDPIPGIGGHMLIPKEKSGLHANDEAYKMATTDALSTAMKMLGVAADIYAGAWDGSKYRDNGGKAENKKSAPVSPQKPKLATKDQRQKLMDMGANADVEMSDAEVREMAAYFRRGEQLTYDEAQDLIDNFDERLTQWIEATKEKEPA